MRAALSILVLIFGALSFLWQGTARQVLAINESLRAHITDMQNAPHPVHDAELTIWHEQNGTILVMVNGKFPHRLLANCGSEVVF